MDCFFCSAISPGAGWKGENFGNPLFLVPEPSVKNSNIFKVNWRCADLSCAGTQINHFSSLRRSHLGVFGKRAAGGNASPKRPRIQAASEEKTGKSMMSLSFPFASFSLQACLAIGAFERLTLLPITRVFPQELEKAPSLRGIVS